MNKDIEFVLLLERMKNIFRRTKIIDVDRRENDAEHSWHVATMAIFLDKYCSVEIDLNKVVKMLLIHDLVEIFAGDTFAYDIKGNEDKLDREKEAIKKLKSYLDDDKSKMLENLWVEFENKETNDSKFANAMDRLQPILSNIMSSTGGTWKENNVKLSQVLKRAEPIKILDSSIYDYVYGKILENVENGNIVRD